MDRAFRTGPGHRLRDRYGLGRQAVRAAACTVVHSPVDRAGHGRRPVGVGQDRRGAAGPAATARSAMPVVGDLSQLPGRHREDRQRLPAVPVDGAEEVVVVQDRVRGLAEGPLRPAELGVLRVEGRLAPSER